MAKSNKRRKSIIFGVIGLVLVSLTVGAIVKKREVIITVQTEKVTRKNLTEIVVANGKIQPVLQVKISPEVSGEIIDLPVKEGQAVKKGDLILKIKPDFYIANRNQAEASFKSSLAGKTTAEANLEKAEAEFKRNQELFQRKLISDSVFVEFKTAFDIANAQLENANQQIGMSRALLARAEEELAKTTIVSPLDGTVSKLNSQLGERVVGTATMAGTEVMTVADLNEMEARVDIGEIDVVLIAPAQNTRMEVDAFKDRKFTGTVTEIANSSKGSGLLGGGGGGTQQEATKFEVKIRIDDRDVPLRPGLSCTADIETATAKDVVAVPMQTVTIRTGDTNLSPEEIEKRKAKLALRDKADNKADVTNERLERQAEREAQEKLSKVVFLKDGGKAKLIKVTTGISDDSYTEIKSGIKPGDEVISGTYSAITRKLKEGAKVSYDKEALK